MEWRTFVLAKAILFLFAVVTFIAYNFWELHRDSKAAEAERAAEAEEALGHVSEPADEEPPV